MGPSDSVSDAPGIVWVCLTVCLMHQILCGSVCQFFLCTSCCVGPSDSLSDAPGVVWVCLTVFLAAGKTDDPVITSPGSLGPIN